MKISKLVFVGVSYSGYANAELVATHPELHADALVVVDSYLDLPARYRAIPDRHPTQVEIETALGGTLAERPQAYEARSPSHHLAGLAAELERGMRLVVVWSVAAAERREFPRRDLLGANAEWLSELADDPRARGRGLRHRAPARPRSGTTARPCSRSPGLGEAASRCSHAESPSGRATLHPRELLPRSLQRRAQSG